MNFWEKTVKSQGISLCPNFEKVEGAYCYRLARPSFRTCRQYIMRFTICTAMFSEVKVRLGL